jgi:hypothetical protein
MSALVTLVSMLVLALCAIVQPSKAVCPTAWHVSTVLPSGEFGCARTPAVELCASKRGCDDDTPDPEVRGRIFCTGGAVPIQRGDGRTVGCMRVGRH